MVINKKASKIKEFCVLQVIIFSLKFFGTVFASSSFDLASTSIISSDVNTKYFPFLQLNIAGFQI